MKRTLLFILGGIVQAFVLFVAVTVTTFPLLDEYTSDTLAGTLIQLGPSIIGAALFFVIPLYLAFTKRGGDAQVFLISSILFGIALVVFMFTFDPGDFPIHADFPPDDGLLYYCPESTVEGMSDEEKARCVNWCPYKGPLLGGGYWTYDAEPCVYL